jgi:thiol-disulfide isomerase/thioredoxin
MKKIILAISILLFSGVQICAQRPVKYIPDTLVQGKKITIEYNSNKTPLNGKEDIKGIIYLWENYTWRADDLVMKHRDSVWVSEYQIPEGAALIVPVFKAGELIDKGDKGTYCQFVLSRSGRSMPSSYIGWAMLRNKSIEQYNIPGYCDTANAIADNIVLFWLNQELRYNPEERANMFRIGIDMLKKTNAEPDKLKKIAESDILFILSLKEPTQKQLLDARDVCDDILKDNILKTRVDSSLTLHFPENIIKRDELIIKAFREQDFARKEAILDELISKYPPESYKGFSTQVSELYTGKIFQSVIYNKIVTNNDYSLLDKYLHVVPRDQFITFYWHLVQLAYRDKKIGEDKLLMLSNKMFDEIKARPREGKELSISPSEWADMFYPKYKTMLLTHADLLLANGSKVEAFEIADKIKPYFENKSTDFNDVYVRILEANGYQNLLIPYIKESLEKNAATPEMLDIMKQEYVRSKGSDKGFEEYVNKIKSPADSEKMHEELLRSMIKEKIDLYSFESMSGGRVDMAALKGKIIVIDFWATWCAPCKAALPGMQMAVNKYKDDSEVAFYFVATQEYKPGFKDELRQFVKDKGYSINVLFDNPDAEGRAQAVYSKYASKFRFSGIPHKLIIDGNGYLRWSSTGYYGSPTKLADEISFIIDYLKKEK